VKRARLRGRRQHHPLDPDGRRHGRELRAERGPAARSWATAVYSRLFYWNELERGGHFASLEVPDLFTTELRRCFQSLRGDR